MTVPPLTQDRLHLLLSYDGETGIFTRKVRTSSRANVGDIAGWLSSEGYRFIHVGGRIYAAHRLAWLYMHGVWPENIDHINTQKGDNRIANLRECARSQNGANQRRKANNRSGFKGVSALRSRWRAQIRINGELLYLGLHDTPEAAHAAYLEAADRLFGEFARAA